MCTQRSETSISDRSQTLRPLSFSAVGCVDAIALRVEGLVTKMESAAAGLAVAAKKALTAARDDSRDNSPAFVKASFEPSLPRVGLIVEELKDEEDRAAEMRRSREPDYIACAPKLPSILDDLPVVHAK